MPENHNNIFNIMKGGMKVAKCAIDEHNSKFNESDVGNYRIKDIPGYEGLYKIDSLGRVWGCRTKRFLKVYDNGRGYVSICLCKNNVSKGFLVHRLVAITFIPNIMNYSIVNHKNFDTHDNRVINLEWVTTIGNKHHSLEYNPGTKLQQDRARESAVQGRKKRHIIINEVSGYIEECASQKEVAQLFGLAYGDIWQATNTPKKHSKLRGYKILKMCK